MQSDLGRVGRTVGAVLAVALATVAGLLVTRSRRTARGAGALLAGIVGVAFGPVGVMSLVKAGISLTSVVGTAAAVAGLTLLVIGAVMLVRSLPRWWKLLALPVTYVLLQFVLLPVTMAAYATHVPPTPLERPAPAGARTVTFDTEDGVTLSAWYTPTGNGASVLLLHGSGSTRASTAAHAAVLAQHGYGVLALDARGHGDSGGHAMDFGWYGDLDLAAALDWLSAQPDVDPARIAAVGLSMGGEQAITRAGSDARLVAVVAEGASARVAADTPPASGAEGGVERAVGWVQDAAAGLMTRAARPEPLTEAVAGMGLRPLLLVAGEEPAETASARRLVAVSPQTVTLWELPDTPHIAAIERHPDAWGSRVVGFLDEALGG